MSCPRPLAAVALAAALLTPAAVATAGGDGHGGHGAAGGGGDGQHVSMAFAAFVPASLDVVTGEGVTWHNESARAHDVASDAEGEFASGRMATGATFAHRFERPGEHPYHCRLHPGMRGTVRVADVLLARPAEPTGPGRPVALGGRTAMPERTPVVLETEDGRAVAETSVAAGGTFRVEVAPQTTTTYRAVVGEARSAPVTLVVLDRRVRGGVVRGGRRATVTAVVTPSSPGTTAVLQARSAERFGWFPIARATVDRASRVRFAVPLRRRLPLRVVLTLPDGATVLASSGPLPTRHGTGPKDAHAGH